MAGKARPSRRTCRRERSALLVVPRGPRNRNQYLSATAYLSGMKFPATWGHEIWPDRREPKEFEGIEYRPSDERYKRQTVGRCEPEKARNNRLGIKRPSCPPGLFDSMPVSRVRHIAHGVSDRSRWPRHHRVGGGTAPRSARSATLAASRLLMLLTTTLRVEPLQLVPGRGVGDDVHRLVFQDHCGNALGVFSQVPNR